MQSVRRVNISISPENHLGLKKCGFAGDSFNDVITQLLRDRKNDVAGSGSGLRTQDQTTATRTTGLGVPKPIGQ